MTNSQGSSVSAIRTATNTVAATIDVCTEPIGIAMAPDGRHVYVSSQSDGWVISVIDTATNVVLSTTRVGTGPGFVAATARNVYVSDTGSSTISVIDV